MSERAPFLEAEQPITPERQMDEWIALAKLVVEGHTVRAAGLANAIELAHAVLVLSGSDPSVMENR